MYVVLWAVFGDFAIQAEYSGCAGLSGVSSAVGNSGSSLQF